MTAAPTPVATATATATGTADPSSYKYSYSSDGRRRRKLQCKIVPLHDMREARRREATRYCVGLLNAEWHWDYAERRRWLNESNSDFPASLVIFYVRNTPENYDPALGTWSVDVTAPKRQQIMIGHSRVSRVHGDDQSCYISAVTIEPGWRGRGFGRQLVKLSERYARHHGFKRAYLYIDKPELVRFYRRLGYRCNIRRMRDPVLPLDEDDVVAAPDRRLPVVEDLVYLFRAALRQICRWFRSVLPGAVCPDPGGGGRRLSEPEWGTCVDVPTTRNAGSTKRNDGDAAGEGGVSSSKSATDPASASASASASTATATDAGGVTAVPSSSSAAAVSASTPASVSGVPSPWSYFLASRALDAEEHVYWTKSLERPVRRRSSRAGRKSSKVSRAKPATRLHDEVLPERR